MSASAINSTIASADTATNPNSNLTQANFLQLLVTQMTSQDPLNPESDTDFAAQLAQFSALQESSAMASSMTEMQANSLIGATVTVGASSNSTKTVTGTVSAVDITSGAPEIEVNGQLYSLSQVQSIAPPPVSTQTSSSGTSN